jgi:predicted metal-binding membrane protein
MMPMEPAWSVPALGAGLAMWVPMMVAMMLPVVWPVVRAHAAASRRHGGEDPALRTAAFVGGYFAVWSMTSVIGATAQWTLHAVAVLAPMGASRGSVLSGAVLVAAGGYQLLPLKHACLRRCRTPLGFLLTDWRPGARGALTMGLRHGTTCVLCCWALMSLLLVVGAMNLWWMAALTVFMLVEQRAPLGHQVARGAGGALAVWGAWTLLHAIG